MATQILIELARQYLSIVDHGSESDQREKRTAAHDAMMTQMRLEGVPFNSRIEARWIARWLVSGKPNGIHGQVLMFAQPLCGNPEGASILFSTPPDDNCSALVPVFVTIQSFENFPNATCDSSS